MDFSSIFDEMRECIDSVRPSEAFIGQDLMGVALEETEKTFENDCARIDAIRPVLFEEACEKFGEKTTDIFADWENAGGGPSLLSMVVACVEEYGLDVENACVKAALLSAIMAEIPNDLQYHGNEHYRKVLFHVVRLITTHNLLFKDTNRAISKDQIASLLTASCIHDLGHEGGDNLREGMYTPGKMEQQAFDIARDYYEYLGVDSDQLGDIETMVFCTDITFFAGDNSPCIRMKKIYRHYFWDDKREDVSMMMMGKLRRFEDNPRLVLMAMILHEADVATSAGVSYEQTVKETIDIMEERGVTNAGPRTVLAFLREQLGETMFTEAGRQLYGEVMSAVIKQAEADIERGRETYYES